MGLRCQAFPRGAEGAGQIVCVFPRGAEGVGQIVCVFPRGAEGVGQKVGCSCTAREASDKRPSPPAWRVQVRWHSVPGFSARCGRDGKKVPGISARCGRCRTKGWPFLHVADETGKAGGAIPPCEKRSYLLIPGQSARCGREGIEVPGLSAGLSLKPQPVSLQPAVPPPAPCNPKSPGALCSYRCA